MSTVYKTYVSDFKEALSDARRKIQEAQVVDGGTQFKCGGARIVHCPAFF